MRQVAKKIAEEDKWNEMIPSSGRVYPKKKERGPRPTSKSYERHMRETLEKQAKEMDMSATSLRRVRYIIKFGSKELKRMCDDGEIDIKPAYFIAKQEHEAKVWRALNEVVKERLDKEKEGCLKKDIEQVSSS